MAVGTFALRFSVLGGMGNRRFAPWVERALALVLPAIFAAIATPMLLQVDGDLQLRSNAPKVIAALVALLAATRTRGYLLPIVIGMIVLHLLQWVLQRA
jgi:branched-subunit amino acid transport protein